MDLTWTFTITCSQSRECMYQSGETSIGRKNKAHEENQMSKVDAVCVLEGEKSVDAVEVVCLCFDDLVYGVE